MLEGLQACPMLPLQAMIRFRTRTRTRQLRPARWMGLERWMEILERSVCSVCSVLLMPVSMPGIFLARRPRQKG